VERWISLLPGAQRVFDHPESWLKEAAADLDLGEVTFQRSTNYEIPEAEMSQLQQCALYFLLNFRK
jgi:hypothetical protein